MSFVFQRDQVNSIMLTVLKLSGGIPSYPSNYTQPQFRISHINGGSEVEDVPYTNMTQVPTTNRWFYKYTIPSTAAFTKYLVTFKTILQGITSESTEEFKVIPLLPSSGAGEFDIQIAIEDEITHAPIAGAVIQIYSMSNPNILLATDTSDNSGIVNVYLNAGIYLANFIKPGDVSEAHKLTVNSDGTYTVEGN